MATNLDLDDRLIEKAVKIGNHKSKKEAVTAALIEYINYRNQLKTTELFGTIVYDPEYNYKKLRNKK